MWTLPGTVWGSWGSGDTHPVRGASWVCGREGRSGNMNGCLEGGRVRRRHPELAEVTEEGLDI